jgi:hypothetical protein
LGVYSRIFNNFFFFARPVPAKWREVAGTGATLLTTPQADSIPSPQKLGSSAISVFMLVKRDKIEEGKGKNAWGFSLGAVVLS